MGEGQVNGHSDLKIVLDANDGVLPRACNMDRLTYTVSKHHHMTYACDRLITTPLKVSTISTLLS